jgi:hypothetical protein
MKTLNKIKTNLAAKTNTLTLRAKAAIQNEHGMEVLQVLIIVIISLVLGALLLATMKMQFTTQLTSIGTKLTDLFN